MSLIQQNTGVSLDRKSGVTLLRKKGVCLDRKKGVCFSGISNLDSKSIIALVTAGIALLTSIYGILHSRKIIYINAVTTARLKYSENLRNNISEFCSLILRASTIKLDELQTIEITEKLNRLRFTIKLLLNRRKDFDKKFLDQLDRVSNFSKYTTEEILMEINQLTNYAQDIFALEWDGIKLEASNGKLSRRQSRQNINKHKKTYGYES